jgi:hypothetical protein
MRVILSSALLIETLEEPVEDALPADLALALGVVALGLDGGAELDGGHEEDAGLADGLEVAVHVQGAGAVAVAEHAAVHLGAQAPHVVALVVGGQLATATTGTPIPPTTPSSSSACCCTPTAWACAPPGRSNDAARRTSPFRVLAANQAPDHVTIARFRARHQQALAGFLVASLKLLCGTHDLLKLWRQTCRQPAPMPITA